MRAFTYSSSDDSSSDDEPLLLKKNVGKSEMNGASGDGELYERRVEICEFCDHVSSNRYDSLVHNATHIVIPLLKNSVHQCSECHNHFPTSKELHVHRTTEHITIVPDILESIVKSEPVIKCDDSITKLMETKKENDIKRLIIQSPIVKCDDDITELIRARNLNNEIHLDLVKHEAINDVEASMRSLASIVHKEAVIKCDNSVTEMIKANIEMCKPVVDDKWSILQSIVEQKPIVKCDNTVTELCDSKIKSRIIFEDDFEDDIISFDVSPPEETPMLVNGHESNNGVFLLGKKVEETEDFNSIHYDELMVPGEYSCKRCTETFPNRFRLVVHETTHMTATPSQPSLCTICDRYIPGNSASLMWHRRRQHPGFQRYTGKLENCEICGWQYRNRYNHNKNYHNVYACRKCKETFVEEEAYDKHKREHKVIVNKLVKLCDVCSIFQSSTKYKYECTGQVSNVGEMQQCVKCKKRFYEVNLVRVTGKALSGKPWVIKEKHDKNEIRLKVIQKRFKMMNKLSRL